MENFLMKAKKVHPAVIQDWILKYIKKYGPVSILDIEFHDKFYEEFGGRRKFYMWGASPVYRATRTLKTMYDSNILDRGRIGIPTQPGFPKWVYCYYLKKW